MKAKYKLFKRIVAVVCTICIIFLTISVSAFAAKKKDKAIIIIPGICGSKLIDKADNKVVWFSVSKTVLRRMSCTENGISNNQIEPKSGDNWGVLDTARDLYNNLYLNFGGLLGEYDVKFFSYDWRISCSKAADKLEKYINDNNYSKVILVAHSMGGLVASKYIKKLYDINNCSKVEKFISIGTPYTGAEKAISVMETGEFISLLDKKVFKELSCNFPAVYELLPTEKHAAGAGYIQDGTVFIRSFSEYWNFLKKRTWGCKTNGQPKAMFNTSKSFHDSLITTNGVHIANNDIVDTYKIYGYGHETIFRVRYNKDGTLYFWPTNNGDGTVVTSSAKNNTDTKTYGFKCKHVDLPNNSQVINQVKNIIKGNVKVKSSGNTVLTQPVINEKGWVVGPDKERIIIVAYNINELNIFTKNKNRIISENEILYYVNSEGQKIEVGTVWSLGDNSYELVLYNGNYKVDIEKDELKNSKIIIEYMDSGYITKSAIYNSIDNFELSVENYASKRITCYNNSSIIYPTKILSQTELNLLNDNDLNIDG